MKELTINILNDFEVVMFLQLISIFGCDNKSSTISVRPMNEAKTKGVLSQIRVQFHKYIIFEISWHNYIEIL